MLNIPEAIKTLYKQDSIRKNFRVHFPNGEMPDITNANIVSESVSFTESLCSQQYLKFGLTEASEIQFETVGIGNMLGMTIECYNEIDISSLSAQVIAEIQSGDYDGELVTEEDSDIDFGYYRLPYGTFTVNECPRNHGAMTHRRVAAYTEVIPPDDDDWLDDFTRWKLRQQYTSKRYLVGLNFFTPSLYGTRYDPHIYSRTEVSVQRTVRASFPYTPNRTVSITLGNTSNVLTFQTTIVTDRVIGTGDWGHYTGGSLMSAYRSGYSYSALQDALRSNIRDVIDTEFSSSDIDWSTTIYDGVVLGSKEAVVNCAVEHILDADAEEYFIPYISYNGKDYMLPQNNDLDIVVDMTQPVNISDWEITVPYAASEVIVRHQSASGIFIYKTATVPTTEISGAFAEIYETELNAGQAIWFPSLYLDATNTTRISGTKYYSFTDAMEWGNLIGGILELGAKFLRSARGGGYKIVGLDAETAEPIVRSEYSDLWWDEYDVEPIGTIEYDYLNSDDSKESTTTYQFGEGGSVYEMKDNYYLKKAADLTENGIKSILDTYFIPNIANVNFTPIDLDMRGLPYLENGDYVGVTAEDGVTVNSYILKHTISGIQSLMDSVESTNGELMSSEEVED